MDSVTQLVLGSAVAEACIGRTVGRRATVYGAVVATLPDLDVFVPLGGAIEDFVLHRSATHSLLVLSVAAPLLAWLIQRFHRPPRATFTHWWFAMWMVLITHPLLDAFTIYGTQLLWPLSDWPFGAGSIFIIDPLFTVPVALGVLAVLVLRQRRTLGHVLNAIGLGVGACYLAFGLLAQAHLESWARQSLQRQGVAHQHLMVLAAPLTSLAWRVVAVDEDRYHVAWHSLLAPAEDLRLRQFAREPQWLESFVLNDSVLHLLRFTKGMYTVEQRDGEVRISDLRMGVEPDRYAFTFVVAEVHDGIARSVLARRAIARRFRGGDWSRLLAVLRGAPHL